MAKSYQRQSRYTIAVRLIKGSYTKINGVNRKNYEETEIEFRVARKSYGGTEVVKNGVVVIEDTYVIECHYRKDITGMDAIKFLSDGSIYEILNRPEDIGDEHRTMVFKVRKYSGGI